MPSDKSDIPASHTLGDVLHAGQAGGHISEAEWVHMVRRIGAGDLAALRQLYELTQGPVFTLALRIVRQREVAEQVTEDVFFDVWKFAHKGEPAAGTVLGWIMHRARFRAIERAACGAAGLAVAQDQLQW